MTPRHVFATVYGRLSSIELQLCRTGFLTLLLVLLLSSRPEKRIFMWVQLVVLTLAWKGFVASSSVGCAHDRDCAFYPKERKPCKDLRTDCSRLQWWCPMFPEKLNMECRNTCGQCAKTSATVCRCAAWSAWTKCDRPCGGGEARRTRLCSSINDCEVVSTQARLCNTHDCSRWSTCTRSCGGGSQWKYTACELSSQFSCQRLYQDCNTEKCPSRPCRNDEVHRYNSSSSCCSSSRFRTSCGQFKISSNIIGGVEVKDNEFPWTLFLEAVSSAGSRIQCGAVLIHEMWALTAAHCVRDTSVERIRLTVGFRRNDQLSQTVRANRLIIHPLFNMPYADIAAIKLSTPFTNPLASNSRIIPICLPRGEIPSLDFDCYAAGWGATDRVVHHLSSTLQVAKLRNLPLESCRVAYSNERWGREIDRSMICAGTLSGERDSCAGDSGGPLMCQRCSNCAWYLAGLTSFGPTPCATPGYPGVYTKVLEHELWIEELGAIFDGGLWEFGDGSCQ